MAKRSDKPVQRSPIKGKEDRYVATHHQGSHKVTKKDFMALLTKAAHPLPDSQRGPRAKQTSESRPSDGCSDTRTSQGSPEGKED